MDKNKQMHHIEQTAKLKHINNPAHTLTLPYLLADRVCDTLEILIMLIDHLELSVCEKPVNLLWVQ